MMARVAMPKKSRPPEGWRSIEVFLSQGWPGDHMGRPVLARTVDVHFLSIRPPRMGIPSVSSLSFRFPESPPLNPLRMSRV